VSPAQEAFGGNAWYSFPDTAFLLADNESNPHQQPDRSFASFFRTLSERGQMKLRDPSEKYMHA
jgi:hypothetical protein